MDIKYFKLTDGSIEFHDDKLLIFDKAKQDRKSILLITFANLLLCISFLLKWIETKKWFELILGLFLLISSILLLIKWFKEFKIIDKEIQFTNIDRVRFSILKFDRTRIAQIMTKDNHIRRIKLGQINNQELKDLLIEHNIEVNE